MKKHLRLILLQLGIGLIVLLASCDEEEIGGTCAGCPSNTPWSVFGSDQCYATLDDCEASEKGNCTICDG